MEKRTSPSFEITAVCFPATQRPGLSDMGFCARVQLPDAPGPYSYTGVLSLSEGGYWGCNAWQTALRGDADGLLLEKDFLALPEDILSPLCDGLIAALKSPIRPSNAIVMDTEEFNEAFYI